MTFEHSVSERKKEEKKRKKRKERERERERKSNGRNGLCRHSDRGEREKDNDFFAFLRKRDNNKKKGLLFVF